MPRHRPLPRYPLWLLLLLVCLCFFSEKRLPHQLRYFLPARFLCRSSRQPWTSAANPHVLLAFPPAVFFVAPTLFFWPDSRTKLGAVEHRREDRRPRLPRQAPGDIRSSPRLLCGGRARAVPIWFSGVKGVRKVERRVSQRGSAAKNRYTSTRPPNEKAETPRGGGGGLASYTLRSVELLLPAGGEREHACLHPWQDNVGYYRTENQNCAPETCTGNFYVN